VGKRPGHRRDGQRRRDLEPSWYNQPTGQFYRSASTTVSRTRSTAASRTAARSRWRARSDTGQLTFRDWHPVGGDERDGDFPRCPRDPRFVYGCRAAGGRLSPLGRSAPDGSPTLTAGAVLELPAARGGNPRTGALVPHHRGSAANRRSRSARRTRSTGGARTGCCSVAAPTAARTWTQVSPDLTGVQPAFKNCEGLIPVERATAAATA
jgi:hypothetical protein